MKSTGASTYHELQTLDCITEDKDISNSNGHQDDMPYYVLLLCYGHCLFGQRHNLISS